nr:tyrosine-protein kinase RYK-like [Aedes albopictus]
MGSILSHGFRSTPSPSPYATALLPLNHAHSQQNGLTTTESVYAKPESVCPSRVSYYASSQLTQVYSLSTPARSIHSNSSNPKDKLRRIAVSPDTIICQQLAQEGTYGRIFYGVLHHPLGETRDVLIKTVVDGASLSQVAYLLSEGSTLCGVSHPNILFPVAAVTELSGPPKVAYPLAAKGNLKLYLQSCRDIGMQSSGMSLGTRQLVEFGLQVARGISHLHSLGVLHKDIATRNCVLDSEQNVRVCDNALSRDVFPNDYHCLGDNENRPIKWMALETLEKSSTPPRVTSGAWGYCCGSWPHWQRCHLRTTSNGTATKKEFSMPPYYCGADAPVKTQFHAEHPGPSQRQQQQQTSAN